MTKHTLKILQGENRKIFKVCLAIFSILYIMPIAYYPEIKIVFKTKSKSIYAMSNNCPLLIKKPQSTFTDVIHIVCIVNFEQISQTKNKFLNVISSILKKTTEVF